MSGGYDVIVIGGGSPGIARFTNGANRGPDRNHAASGAGLTSVRGCHG
jgi:hypothetical protein